MMNVALLIKFIGVATWDLTVETQVFYVYEMQHNDNNIT